MNDKAKSSTIQSFAAGFFGFIGILGLGSVAMMMHHGGSVPAKSAFTPRSEPVAGLVLNNASVAAPRKIAAAPAPASSPLPVLPAEAARDASAAPAPAPAAAPAAAASSTAPKLAAAARVDMSGSASSSASSSAPAAVAAAKAKAKPAAALKPLLPPKLDLSKNSGAVASSVHYGVTGRSELMGRAAGPVYNFSGGAANTGGQVAASNATASGALQEVDAAEKQIDASSASDEDKAKIHQQLEQVRATAAPAPASAPAPAAP